VDIAYISDVNKARTLEAMANSPRSRPNTIKAEATVPRPRPRPRLSHNAKAEDKIYSNELLFLEWTPKSKERGS